MRIVLDANVLAPAFANATASAGRLLTHWRSGSFTLVVSEVILTELRRTYQDPYYSRRLSNDLIDAAIDLLLREALVISLSVHVSGIATHPEDDLVLATAASGEADYLGTRDRQLLELGSFHGTVITHPVDLDAMLDDLTTTKIP